MSFGWLNPPEQSLNLFYSDDVLWLSFFVINTSPKMRMTLLEMDGSCRKACRVIMCYLMIDRQRIVHIYFILYLQKASGV